MTGIVVLFLHPVLDGFHLLYGSNRKSEGKKLASLFRIGSFCRCSYRLVRIVHPVRLVQFVDDQA